MGDLICHYTTLEVLLSLLRNAEDKKLTFWASSIYSMNNPTEFMYGYDICMDILQKVEKRLKVSDKLKVSKLWMDIHDDSSNDWKEILIQSLYENNECPFVVSFSKLKDSLPLWKMYGNNGYGVCLVFSEYLVKPFNPNGIEPQIYNSIHLYDVGYGTIHQSEYDIFNKIVESRYKKYLSTICQNGCNNIFEKKLSLLCLTLVICSPCIKHPSYAYEQEKRLLKYYLEESNQKVQFYEKNNNIISYTEVQIPIDNLKEIIVGPCSDFQSISRSITQLLHSQELNPQDIKIVQSEVPYRN